ncbi:MULTISPECIES: alkaline phosphatase family protein [unclassified Chelatococcus]|uniref:alkaline phosphatase family protein n=1 Tax=unclassified Chelatococcus TaxID=2638111 RepID=UPI001BCD0057|nr:MULTISPECIES: alkaline phosphatase family protein [unclassified Chelatococcus]MBS7700933.1 alkaline phosphatase family protein [Chelatococcus sp. YT9]MBX3555466.1 alkaline phosphatase family protein [Chelatococcus sp.]
MAQDDKPTVRRVIVTVFDGLRPDLVSPELTPNILRVAAQGTWFREARSVFPSVTRVATTSIATGAPPTVHGIVGNAFYHREALPDDIFLTGDIDHIRRAERYHGGRMVDVDTLGDVLARAGRRLAVVHTGSAGAAHFINPRAKTNGHWTFSMHGPESTQTPEAVAEATAHIGPLPKRELPRLGEMRYAGRLMVDYVLPKLQPDVAIVWFNEPDTTFHYKGLGSQEAKTGLAEADRALGEILDWIESQHDGESVAVIVASDHGQISTGAVQPLFADATAAGFKVNTGHDISDVMLTVTGGISGEIRLRGDDQALVGRMARWLMEQPLVGHVFSRARNEVEGEIAGTLSLDLMGNGHLRQPDLMFILRSDLSEDQFGLPGLGAMTPGDVPLGGGMHGGINPHELNTVLIVGAETAEGRGSRTSMPAGIIDITPTVLGLLGMAPSQTMRGRNLTHPFPGEPQVKRYSAGDGSFAQHVDMVEHAGRRFILGGGH